MNAFIKFILFLIVIGVVLNLTIVLVANHTTELRQDRAMTTELEKFERVVTRQDGRLRRAEMVVEWQKTDTTGNVLESSLLFRRYSEGEDGRVALGTQRIVVPGDRVCVDGITFNFGEHFTEKYKPLRGKRLFFYGKVYVESQPKEKRFSFFVPGTPPAASQVHPSRPTHLESRLWQYIGDLMANPRRAKREELKYQWAPPMCKQVRTGLVYFVFMGDEGITISEVDDRLTLNQVLESAPPVKE